MFSNYEQERDWRKLDKTIQEAPATISCTNYPDAFFPDGGNTDHVRLAKKLCSSCPVIQECAIYAIKWELEGVWGGLSAKERAQMRSKHLKRRSITKL